MIEAPWIDLIKGVSMIGNIRQEEDGSVVITDGIIKGNSLRMSEDDKYTIEVCCRVGNGSSLTISSRDGKKSIMLRVTDKSVKFSDDQKSLTSARRDNAISFSANTSRVSNDDEDLVYTEGSPEIPTEEGICISVIGSVSIFAVRIYNRIKDSKRNAQTDLKRFGEGTFVSLLILDEGEYVCPLLNNGDRILLKDK